MSNAQRSRDTAGATKYEDEYSVELARGSSHIASTRTSATLNAAIAEVIQEFITHHGAAHSDAFMAMLAVRLDARQSFVAAAMVRRVAKVGLTGAIEEARTAERGKGPDQPRKVNTINKRHRAKGR